MPAPISSPLLDEALIRLNKYIAHSGICSRRKAAELVKEGLVKVNGTTIRQPGYEVKQGDRVEYDGKILSLEEEKVYFLMNKPKNVITTLKDEKGRKTVIDLIKSKVRFRVFPVGRLDRNTTGLLLLTNDGDMAHKLSHPSSQVKKLYQVTLDKPVSQSDLDAILQGFDFEEGKTVVDKVYHIEGQPETIVGIELHIGWNRIIRRLFEHLGYEVVKLDRIYYAGLTKKDLKRGWFRPLTEQELIMLKHFIH